MIIKLSLAHLIHVASNVSDFDLIGPLEPWVTKTSYIDKNIAGNDLEMIASYCEPNQFIYISGPETFVKAVIEVIKSRGFTIATLFLIAFLVTESILASHS